MTTYILYNPKAGKGNINESTQKISALYGGAVECIDVTTIEDLSAFVLGKGEDETIVICGGDGTINKFILIIAQASSTKSIALSGRKRSVM